MRIAVVTLADDSRAQHVSNQLRLLQRYGRGVITAHYRGVLGADRNLARTRNATAGRALDEGAEALIFLDADCVPGEEMCRRYATALGEYPDTVLSGPVTYLPEPAQGGYDFEHLDQLTNPHAARPNPAPGTCPVASDEEWNLFWSLSFAVTADTWVRSGGFDEGYVGYGGEDTDFAYRCREAGLSMRWVGGAHAYHQWHPVSSPPVEHVDDIIVNATRFHRKWGVWPMLGWLEAFERDGVIERTASGWRRGTS